MEKKNYDQSENEEGEYYFEMYEQEEDDKRRKEERRRTRYRSKERLKKGRHKRGVTISGKVSIYKAILY